MGSIVSSILDPITGAGDTRRAGAQAAEQQRQAGITSANISAFRPVGMTTRFGSSQFTREIDPATGVPYISSAGYTAAPELAGLQNQLFGGFGGGYGYAQQQANQFGALSPAAQQLFGLGSQILPTSYNTAPSAEAQLLASQYQQAQQGLMPTSFQAQASPEAQALAQQFQRTGAGYLAQSPEEARAEYIRTQQAALAPGQEQQLSGIRNRLFQTGRGGLATGGTVAGGMQQTNPELAAYYNSLAQQNLSLGAGAEQAAQQRQSLGLGMLGQGYQTATSSEALARQNMLQNLGLSLGFGQQAYQTTASAQDLARQRSAQDIGLGAGLFGQGAGLLGTQSAGMAGAYAPLQTQLGISGQVEQMAQQPYQLGLQLGTAQMPGQQAGSQQYYGGQVQGAATQYGATMAANQMNNQLLQSAISAGAGGMSGGASTGGLFGGNAGSGFGGFSNWLTRGSNQASPDFVGPIFN
jgi:hypothetical protein